MSTSLFRSIMQSRLGDVIALLAGACLPLALAPFSHTWLAFFSAGGLLVSLFNISPQRAFWRGWLFGLSMYGLGVYWVYISLNVYGGSSLFFSILATILLIAAYSLFPAIKSYLFNKFFPKNSVSKCILVFPALWVLFEWIRSWLFTGFPWLLLGYSQLHTWLKGFAPLLSVFGLSFAVVLMSSACVALFITKKQWQRFLLLSFIFALFFIGWGLNHVQWTTPIGRPLKVSLVQGNIPQDQKWQSTQMLTILRSYYLLTAQHWDSDLIIWPECAIVIPNIDAKEYLDKLTEQANLHHAAIITGIPIIDSNQHWFNGILALGDGNGSYRKRHLLPFGDYIPLRFIFDIFNSYVQIPMSDFTHGAANQGDLIAKNTLIAPFICYEIVFPEEVRASFPKAQLMVLVTDDSWFGKSIASAQHLEMGQMRALETGRYLLFSSNSGITAIINNKGEIENQLPSFQQAVLTGTAQPMQGSTPYVFWGLFPVLGLAISFLLWGFIQRK